MTTLPFASPRQVTSDPWSPWASKVDLTAMPDNRITDFVISCCDRAPDAPPFRVKIDRRVAALLLEFVDPKLQRNVSKGGVDYLVQTLRTGEYSDTTHQGIAFTNTNKLIDAQHRLHAVVRAGEGHAIWTWAFFGLPESDYHCMDIGKKRNLADALKAVGCSNPRAYVEIVGPMVYGIAFANGGKIIPQTAIDLAYQHEAAIKFAIECFEGNRAKGISSAITKAVVARAYYSADRDRLAYFVNLAVAQKNLDQGKINQMGFKPGDDDAAAVLVRWLGDGAPRGATGRREQYAKVQSALDHFLRRQSITKLYGVFDRDIFQLPEGC